MSGASAQHQCQFFVGEAGQLARLLVKGLFAVLHAERQQVLAQQAELVRLLRGHALNRCVAADVWHYLICLPGVTHVQDCTTGDSDYSSWSLDQFDSGVTPLG
jgi:hypothetical protein